MCVCVCVCGVTLLNLENVHAGHMHKLIGTLIELITTHRDDYAMRPSTLIMVLCKPQERAGLFLALVNIIRVSNVFYYRHTVGSRLYR